MCACAAPKVHSQSAAPAPLTLADARRLALQRNDDFRVAQIQVAAALAQLRAAREFPNPTLGLSTTKINTDNQGDATFLGNGYLDRSYDSIASLSQLFLVAKRGLIQDAAAAGVRSAESQRDDARRLLVQAVTQAYVAALDAQEQAAVLTESAAALRREADDRRRTGSGPAIFRPPTRRRSRSPPNRTSSTPIPSGPPPGPPS